MAKKYKCARYSIDVPFDDRFRFIQIGDDGREYIQIGATETSDDHDVQLHDYYGAVIQNQETVETDEYPLEEKLPWGAYNPEGEYKNHNVEFTHTKSMMKRELKHFLDEIPDDAFVVFQQVERPDLNGWAGECCGFEYDKESNRAVVKILKEDGKRYSAFDPNPKRLSKYEFEGRKQK